jgi:hypothetical protein
VNKRYINLLLFIFLLASCAQNKQDTLISSSPGTHITVDNQPFFIKGMNWSYSPIGTNYAYSLWVQPEETIKIALDQDMTRLKNIGVNTLRIYAGIPAKWIEYIYYNYGIYTVLNHSFGRYGVMLDGNWNPTTDYGDSLSQKVLLTEIAALVKTYKDTRGLLMYLLGNENNYGLYWEGGETEDIPIMENTDQRAHHLYALFNKASLLIKTVDSTHQIAICNGDLGFLDLIATECPDVDVLGINIYRGISFGEAFQEVKKKYNKPVMFTEFGGDAFNSRTQQEDQPSQAEYLLDNWKEIYQNAAGQGKSENCIGGFTFQWSDGWWKTGQTINLDKHDSTASWSNGGYKNDFVKGQNNMNEEWFGVCAKRFNNSDGTYLVTPRAAYYVLKEVHQLNPYQKDLRPEQLNAAFSKIKVNEAIEKAKILPR